MRSAEDPGGLAAAWLVVAIVFLVILIQLIRHDGRWSHPNPDRDTDANASYWGSQ